MRLSRVRSAHYSGRLHIVRSDTCKGKPDGSRPDFRRRMRRHSTDRCRATGLVTSWLEPCQGNAVARAMGLRHARHYRGLPFLNCAGGGERPPCERLLQQGRLGSQGGLPSRRQGHRNRSSSTRRIPTGPDQCEWCRRRGSTKARLLDIPAVLDRPSSATDEHDQPRSTAHRVAAVGLHRPQQRGSARGPPLRS